MGFNRFADKKNSSSKLHLQNNDEYISIDKTNRPFYIELFDLPRHILSNSFINLYDDISRPTCIYAVVNKQLFTLNNSIGLFYFAS